MVSITSQRTTDSGLMMPPPTPAPITKRPVLGLKRDSSFLDTDDEAGLSVHTKKLKVAFDPNVDVRIVHDAWSDKSLDLVREEVRVGIDTHLAPAEIRDDEQYSRLVTLLRQDPFGGEAASSKLLSKYIVALEARVSILGECGKLAMALLDLSWLGRDDDFLSLYVKFLVSLASAQSKYIPAMMEKLVSHFARLPSTLGRLPGEDPVSRTQMFGRLHLVIKTMIRQIPSTSGTLARTLKFEFPNDLTTTRYYIQYQKNMIRLGEYAPEIKAEVMAIIVQRLVAVDVQIQQDLEDLEEEAEEKLLQRPMSQNDDVEEESDDSDADSISSSEETYTEDEERLKELRLKVSKMDSTMDLLFDHYTPLVKDGSHPELNDAFQQLMSHFITYILPNRTRHAQFLLFHFSQASSAHMPAFAQRCIEAGFGAGVSTQRYSAIAYLSSFIARGAHVPKSTVREVFLVLCEYLEQMRKRYEPSCRGPDRRTYMLYYAVSQAILYIFCFRWRDLVVGPTSTEDLETTAFDQDDILADSGELQWVPGLKEILHKNIFGPMNPLKVCSPAIVSEFADIARHVRLMEVLSKVESNKRLRLGQSYAYYGVPGGIDIGRRETAWDRKTGDAHHQLEPYFPFDPYHLPRSKKWVENDYNEWKLPRGMHRDDDEDALDGYSEDESDDTSDDDSVPDDFDTGVALETASVSS